MTTAPLHEPLSPSIETPYWLTIGEGPLLISAPHHGDELPSALREVMTSRAALSEDTDWFMRELYTPIASALGATLLCARYSRYVVDLNRPASDEGLYPGQRSTGLCPAETFSGEPLYPSGVQLDAVQKEARVQRYWTPYHQALQAQLSRLKAQHGHVLLWEAHSIRSEVPLLFDGQLPDFNLGTYEGRSCHPSLEGALRAAWARQREERWRFVLNGRFKGGYITRAYGAPQGGVNAVQLELSQRVYLEDETRPEWGEATQEKATEARRIIIKLIEACLEAMQRLEAPLE